MVNRWDYTGPGLPEQLPDSPWELARDWVAEADTQMAATPPLHEPRALAVATVDAQGRPDVRVVLMRFFAPHGPGFVSSRSSAKSAQIAVRPVAAASLTWSPLFRAVRFRGDVVEMGADQARAYWEQRP